MKDRNLKYLLICALVLSMSVSSVVLGDWDEGGPHKMHYPQLPDLTTNGMDVLAGPFSVDPNGTIYYEKFVADDFMCMEDGPITGIHIWCSDRNDVRIMEPSFLSLVIYDNIPAGAGGADYSQPGQPLWSAYLQPTVERVYAADVYEQFYDPNPDAIVGFDTMVWQYNFVIDPCEAFIQVAGEIYWLGIHHTFDFNMDGIVNLFDLFILKQKWPGSFGWKTSGEQQWEDNAVYMDVSTFGGPPHVVPAGPWDPMHYPIGHPLELMPIDLAFVIDGGEQTHDELEYCDAPEGYTAVAYPSSGVTGSFPTCLTTGPAGVVQHGNWGAWLGPNFDFEMDGDAGLCPPPGCFPTYDDDECYADGDAGLMFPEPYTIDALLNVVPCPCSPTGTALGIVCQQANWGVDIDLEVHNHMPSDVDGYVNVMCDWFQDGDWGDIAWCGLVPAPEHVLVNFPVPNPFDGPLSLLGPPPFLIGPRSGYVWMRCSITEQPVPLNWDGSGAFEDGESEAYLIRVDPCTQPDPDWGDAPDNWPVGGGYPTLSGNNGANHVISGPWLGDNTDSPDPEPDGQPHLTALGDDMDTIYPPANDDEDGVSFPVLVEGQTDTITFQVSGGVGGGVVQIWIDWSGNMSWLDFGDMVYNGGVPDGVHSFSVTPPAGSAGQTFLRARISTGGGLPPDGPASDGEVEDHLVVIEDAPPVLDYGDAPDPCYPTMLINGGARHVIGGPFFCDLFGGDAPDADPDGQPTALADGDDLDADGDDEDGVSIPNFNQGQSSNILFNVCNAPGGANVQIWIDWNGNGSWLDAGEQVYSNLHWNGNYSVPVTAPAISVIGLTFARCRISTAGGLRPDGLANDGEVEDHTVTIEPAPQELDFGDAPDPCYPTWLASNGARHVIGGPYFCDVAGGDAPDAENDGQPTAWANGDDLDVDGDDEDGVIMPNFNQGQSSNVAFNVCNSGVNGARVQIWIDWDGSGSWDVTEQVYSALHFDGNYSVPILAPGTSVIGLTFARCRISSAGGLGPDGLANDGEVEDHTVTIEQVTQQYDFGDAPDPNYPTWLANNGARHLIQARIYLGNGVDGEADGQPNASATGDDLDGNDDEDGVTFLTPLMPGGWAQIDVNSNALGMLDAWVDFGGDGTWVQPVDQIFASQPLAIGSNLLWFPVPFMAQPGSTFARFRMSTNGGLSYDGLASDGEVEDYEIDIEENPEIKWIQLPDTSPNGIDISVTRRTLADDFECTTYGPITDVHLWCSWKYDMEGDIMNVHLSFHTDDPVGPGGSDPCNLYSQPDELKWQHDFTPGEFTLTPVVHLGADGEWWWDPVDGTLMPSGDWTIYRLDVYIDPCDAFTQEGDPCEPVIYWLDVRVETEFGELGWKTRRWPDHYMDDAVIYDDIDGIWKELRYPWPHPYNGLEDNSIDMAFILTGYETERPKEPVPNLKWQQPPIEIDPTWDIPTYCGWNEESWTQQPDQPIFWPSVADDFRCIGTMPVDSVHWWGSYIDWPLEDPPPVQPARWWFRFWSNVPANPGADPDYSHPGQVLWDVLVHPDDVKTEWVGWDEFPYMMAPETCFQHYVKFKEENVFWQHNYVEDTNDQVFWLNIIAIYPNDVEVPNPWGWKTRPWSWMDDAVVYEGRLVGVDPCTVAFRFWPIEDPIWNESYDVAFELDTDPNYVKYEQPFTGIRDWPHYEDENSVAVEDDSGVLTIVRQVADDWPCDTNRPVTAIAWWGSYIGYTYEACTGPPMFLPPKPDYFLLGIWDDIPAGADPCYPFSHPGNNLWTYQAHDYDEVLVGYDKHPHGVQTEPVFRYSVKLPCEAWFFQDQDNDIYWLSVVAVYKQSLPSILWGWTNHEHVYMDDAVAGTPGAGGTTPWNWEELFDQTGTSEDMSFQLFTDPDPKLGTCWDICQCPCQPQGDCTCNGLVNFGDLFCLKTHFGKCAPWVAPECCADFTQNGCVNFGDLFALKANFGLVCPLPSTGSQKCP